MLRYGYLYRLLVNIFKVLDHWCAVKMVL
jgi:hypothetical protein